MLEEGNSPEEILKLILGDMGLEITDTMPVQFHCNCSKPLVEKVLISLGKKELQSLIDEGKDVELNCHFCNSNYTFSVEEVKKILARTKKA